MRGQRPDGTRRYVVKSHNPSLLNRILIVGCVAAAAILFLGVADAADKDYGPAAADAEERSDRPEAINQDIDSGTGAQDFYQSGPDASLNAPAEKGTSGSDIPQEVTVEKIGEGEWKIINKYGDFVGKIQSDSLAVFRIYDPSGAPMGRITDGGVWFPINSSNRYTKIVSKEVFLYLDALDAIEKVRAAE
jgi:hypothetical protein